MKNLLALIAVFAALSEARASTYECTAVSKKATVAATQSVSITSDTANQTCSFSINGASTGKQAVDAVSILRDLKDGRSVFSGNNAVRDLAVLLMAAALPGSLVPENAFGNSVRNKMSDLEQCVSAFRKRELRTFKDNFGGLSCDVRMQGKSYRTAGVTLTPGDESILEITFRWDKQVHQVFIPESKIR